MIKLAVAGATGRTGRCAVGMALADARFEIAAALTAPGCSLAEVRLRVADGEVDVTQTLDVPCDVLVDFSLPDGTAVNTLGLMVSGTVCSEMPP